ncbi:MAG: class I SAM-dependent methyltransferase [Bryobacteraceae bacterium]
MADPNVLDRMRQDWNERAREDPHYYVAFGRREQDDAEFLASASDEVRAMRAELKRLGPPGKPAPQGLKALEIGCGPGRIMRPLSRDFAEIHGIDISDEMIRLAAQRLRDVPHAHVQHTERSDLSMFHDESFDFVYSYAVFQHIPSRAVVLGYFAEARRVLKCGGILKCQINGLPETSAHYTTWEGVRIQPAEVKAFVRQNDFQLLALEGAGTQYMWTTWRKRPSGWRAALRPIESSMRIRAISNALTGDQMIPASGARAFAAIWVENLPADCDLIGMEVRIEDRPSVLLSISAPEWDGMVQLTAAVPAGCRTGLVPVELSWLGRPLAPPAWMRVVPPGPAVPRLVAVRDGDNQLSGTRIISRFVKLIFEETLHPDLVRADFDGVAGEKTLTVCTDPVEQRHEINFRLPASIGSGPHELSIHIGTRAFPPVSIEVV